MFDRFFACAALSAFCTGFAAQAGAWLEFRGATAQGHSPARNVPVHWSTTNNIAWKTSVGSGWSSPVVAQGRIYLTTAEQGGSSVSLRAVALDAGNGKMVWEREVLRASSEEGRQIHTK